MVESLADYERRFRRAGLPLFIEDYSATEDVFTRALPLLTLVFLFTVLEAVNLEWPLLANVAAFVGGAAILVGAFGLLNVLRGRPFWSAPRKVGIPELVGFVVFPSILPLVFGGQVVSSGVTAAQQLAILGVVYLVVGFGLFSILRWAMLRLFRQLGTSLRLLARAVPLLMVFALVIFLTADAWQVFSAIPRPFLAMVAGLFVALGTLFLGVRLPREVRDLEGTGDLGIPLRPGQRVNVGLVLLISQGLQVFVVSVGVGLFFVAFGTLAVGPEVLGTWIGSSGHVLVQVHVFGHPASVTEELLRVSGGIAAFSGLYYAIAMLIDSTYRDEFLEEITREMRETFAARAEYIRLRNGQARPEVRV